MSEFLEILRPVLTTCMSEAHRPGLTQHHQQDPRSLQFLGQSLVGRLSTIPCLKVFWQPPKTLLVLTLTWKFFQQLLRSPFFKET